MKNILQIFLIALLFIPVMAISQTSTISFDSNGGTPVAPITLDEGDPVPIPADPTRVGFTFLGWVPSLPAFMPVDDMTCVAFWDQNPVISTISPTGACAGSSGFTIRVQGSGFDATSIIKIDSYSQGTEFFPPNTLQCVIFASELTFPGTLNITVVDPGGVSNAVPFTVTAVPSVGTPGAQTACDSYTLPLISGVNLSGNQAYYNNSQALGGTVITGPITSTQTVWVYDETGTTPNCSNEESFVVTINTTPTADAPVDVTACDSYTLPSLTVGNYFSGSGGTGTAYTAGDPITSSMTMYVYAETATTPNCTDENSFSITINTTPTADAPVDVTACDSYTLPSLTVGNYFSGSGGTGTAYTAGDPITSSMTMYVYAETATTPNCTDENSFSITINTTPTADAPVDVTACDSYTLPSLTVGNYFSGSGGTGTAYTAGDPITSSMTMYVYAETATTPNCTDENSFNITVDALPTGVSAGTYGPLCEDTAPILLTGSGGPGSGVFSGTGVTYSAPDYYFDPAGLGGTSPLITYTVTNGSCSDFATTNIDVDAFPAGVDAGAYGPVCENASPILLIGSGGPGAGVFSGTGVSFVSPDYLFDPSGLGGTSQVITYTVTNGTCSDFATTNITVDAFPTGIFAGTYPSLCEYDSPIGLDGGGGPGTGEFSGIGVSWIPPYMSFTPSGLGGTSPLITYTVTNGSCSDFATTNITVDAFPTGIDAGTYPSLSEYDSPIVLTGSGVPGTRVFSGTGVSYIAPDYIFTPCGLGGTSPLITYTVTNGSCSDFATTNITVNAASTGVDAGTYGPLCEDGSPIVLTGSGGPGAGAGVFSGTGVSFVSPDYLFDPSGLGGTSQVITYTVTNGTCSDFATTNITVDAFPTGIFAGTYPSLCENGSPIVLTGSGGPGAGVFSGTGVSFVSPDYLFTPSGLGGTSPLITYTVTNGSCSDFATTNITVDAFPTGIDAGTYPSLSEYDSPIVLTGSGVPGTRVFSGTGVSYIAPDYIFTPCGLGGTSPLITYTVTNGSCSDFATTNITVDAASTGVDAGTYGPLCEDGSPIVLTGSGGPGAGAGVFSGTGVSFVSPDYLFDPTGLGGTSPLITYTVTNGSCSDFATTNITVDAFPTGIDAGTYPSLCENGSPIVLTGSGGPGAGVFSGTGVSFVSPDYLFDPSGLGGTSQVITYTVTNGTCSDFATTNITVDAFPTGIFAGTYPSLCEYDSPIGLDGGGGPGLGAFSGIGVSWIPPYMSMSFTPSGLGGTSPLITYTVTNGSCSDFATTNITVVALPTVEAGPDQTFCSGVTSVTMAGYSVGGGATTGAWSGGGGGWVGDVYTPTAGEISSGSVILTYSTTDASPCTDVSDFMTVYFIPDPTISFTATTPLGAATTTDGSPNSITLNFCGGEMFTFSGYSSNPGSNVGKTETIATSGNVLYNGSPHGTGNFETAPAGMSAYFSGTYGPYSLSSGTYGTITQTYTPYYELDGVPGYSAGDCLGLTVTMNYVIGFNVAIAPTGAQSFCLAGTGSLLTATETGVNGPFTHQWGYRTASLGPITDIGPATGSTYTPSGADFPTSGTYYVVCKSTSSCTVPVTAVSNEVTVNIPADNTAGAASGSPTPCINTAMLSITHSTSGATGIANDGVSGANGLPAGVSATWAADVITISGTPTASGPFSYSILLTGGCGTANATGTITVTPDLATVAINETAAQTLCVGVSPGGSALTLTETGGGTITARQWGYRTVSGGSITAIGSATGATYTPTPADLGPATAGTRYIVCTSTPTCGSPVISNEVTVNITSDIYDVAANTYFCTMADLTATYAPGSGRVVHFPNGADISPDGLADGYHYSPGMSPGCLAAGSTVWTVATTWDEEVATATSACVAFPLGYDQLNITGTLDIGGANLTLAYLSGYTPVTGDVLTIITTTGGITGTFAGYGEGSSLTVGANKWVVSYSGGNVTLTYCTPPAITCPANQNVTTNTGCTYVGGIGSPTTTVYCGLASLTSTPSGPYPLGTTTVTWKVTDNSGQTATCSHTVTVTDDDPPSITCPSNVVISSDPSFCAKSVNFTHPVPTDNCSGVLGLTYQVGTDSPLNVTSISSDYTFPVGITIVKYTATDVAGNTTTCSFTVTVNDNTPPTITNTNSPANRTAVNTPGQCTAPVLWTPLTASDNCTGVLLANNYNPGYAFPVGVTTVIYTATDAHGNTTTTSFTVTVTDTEKPVIVGCPANINLPMDAGSCGAIVSWTEPTATDNCTIPISPVRTDGTGIVNGALVPAGVYTITYSATDGAIIPNTSLPCSFTITVQPDVELPVWTTAAGALNTTLECSDAAGIAAAQALVPAASDNCTSPLTPVKTAGAFVAGSCPQAGTYTNTWTVSDAGGNAVAAVYTQVITITDNTIPTWTTAALALDATVQCSDAAALATAQGLTPAASDNCDGTLTPVKTAGAFVAGSCPQAGTYTNTWTVSDDCGNAVAAVYTQIITVIDNTAPTWTTAALALDATVQCSDIAGLATAQGLTPAASDNCDGSLTPVKTAGSFVAGACPQAGTYTNTWTVSDDCGNVVAGIYTQTITVIDNTAPTWTTAALALDATLECSDIAGLATAQGLTPAASDNCDGTLTPVKTAGAFVAGSCPQAGTYTNTWTVSDDCGNVVAGVYTQVITITDNTAPTWTTAALALDATLECSNIAGLATAQGLTPAASDNCDLTLTPVKTAGLFAAGACPQAGTYTNTWTVSDDCGNVVAGVYTQVITITDNTAPTWTTAALALDATLECSDIAGLATAQGLTPAASDNCDLTLTPVKTAGPFVAGACPQAGTYTNTWTVSDDCGNVVAGVYTQVITITDNTAPTWTTAALALDATVQCSDAAALATAQGLTPAASDNCDGSLTPVKTAGSFVAGACPQAGTYTNTWTVSDDCGNVVAGIYTQTITVIDNTAPTWTTAALALDATLECSDIAGLATAQGLTPAASDNCDGTLTPVKTAGAFVAGSCPQAGTYTNTWTVSDDCGNIVAGVYTQVITITDNTAPTWTTAALALDATLECSDIAGLATAQGLTPAASDNCDLTLTPVKTAGPFVAGACPQAGTYTNTWTVSDDCGNVVAGVYTQVITITDNTAPTWTTAALALDATLECSDIAGLATAQGLTPAASDNCDLTLTPVKTAGPFVAGACPQAGTYTNTWTVSDDCGNVVAGVYTQVITITDNTAPTWTTAALALDATVQCSDAAALATAQGLTPAASDNCDGSLTPVKTAGSFVAGACPQAGTYTNTWTVSDDCGNVVAGIYTQTITVIDNTAPTWTTAALALDATLECSDIAGLATAQGLTPAASDNCDGTLTPVKTAGAFVAGSCPQAGTYTNTWTVSDDCGNIVAGVYTQVITITDNTAPTWTTAALALDATLECSDIAGLATAQGLTPAASDNCDLTLTPVKTAGPFVAGACPQAGTYTNTWTVSDDCGNVVAGVYTQVITITDNTAPTWTTAALALDATLECSDIAGLATAQGLTPAASDNCDGSLTPVKTAGAFVAGACPQAGTYTNTWTVSDDCGNVVAGIYTQVITITDNTAPTWTTAALALDATLECSDIAGLATAQGLNPVASDNCDLILTPVKTAGSFVAGACPQAGTYTNTWTVSDDCGNVVAGVYTQVITITDNTAPTWTTAALALDATLECSDISGLATAQGLTPVASDNCDLILTPVKTAGSFVAGACPQAGTYTNTWTVSDDCGNVVAGVYTQVITITDNTAPTWTTAALALDATLECSDIAGLATAQGLTPAASDNCDGTLTPVKTAGAFIAGSCPQAGTYTNTWTVSDDCGNVVAGVYTQVITITDNTAPTWTTAALALDATLECSDIAGLATAQGLTPAASDNCDGSLTPVKTAGPFVAGACPQAGTYTNTWTVSDDCGNVVAGVYTQVITITDNTAPTWTTAALALDATLECSDIAGLATAQGLTPVASDNCDLILTPVKTAGSFVAGACPQAGTYTNTWTVSDDCGNVVAGVYTQVITITDNTAPTWTTAALALDATLECSDISGLATAQGLNPVASDNCDGSLTPVKTAGSFVAGACPQAGTYTNTWTVSDDCGNVVAGVYTQVITITDLTAPTWTTAAGALNATVQCSDAAALAAAQALVPVAIDNCDGSLTPVKSSGAFVPGVCPSAGTYTNTWTVSDDCGNSVATVYIQTITVIDITPPTLVCPGNIALNASASCTQLASWTIPVPTDNCSGVVTLSYSVVPFVPISIIGTMATGLFDVGVTTITYTASDCIGNTTTCSFTVTVTDVTSPTITGIPATINKNNTPGLCSSPATWPPVMASDNCPGVTLTSNWNSGDIFPVGTTTVIYTATDAHSNVTTASFNVIVTDNEKPTWTTAANNLDRTLQCSDIAGLATAQGLNPVATDNCTSPLTPVKTAGLFVAGACPQAGTYTNTWTVADAHGNTVAAVYTQTITLIDNTIPVWTTVAGALDATVQCSDVGGFAAAQALVPVASDNCDGSLTPVKTAGAFVAGSCPQAGTYTNTWTVSDDCGNAVAAVYTQIITVIDNTAPTWTTAALALDATVQCSDIAGLATAQGLTPAASDNCDGTLTPVKTAGLFIAGACPQAGTYTNTWTVSDDCGNAVAAVYTQIITVIDNTAPTWTTAALALDATLECSDIAGLATAQGLTPAASDNCDGTLTPVKTAGAFVAGSCPQAGTYTNTWTVSDDCGNVVAGVYTQVITITDNTAPTWTTAALALDATLECSDIAGLATAQGLTPVASDNCDGSLTPVKTAGSFVAGACPQAGTYTNTWTVSDDCGNVVAGVYTQVITITDNTAPTWTTAALALDATLECSDIAGLATAQGLTPAASDNCDGSLTPVKTAGPFVAGACPQAGTYTNTWTVSDDCGNVVAGVYTQVITITDNTAPTWTTAALALDATLECSDIAGLATAQGLTPAASDNCDGSLTPVKTAGPFVAGACPQAGTYTNTWTVSDDCGNVVAGVYTQVITITDNTAPTWTTAALALDATLECSDIAGLATAQGLNPVASDNCDLILTPVKTAGSFVAGACPQAGTYTNTWTVSDDCGNVIAGVYTQVITITDNTAPTWTTAALALDATLECSDIAGLATAQGLTPAASDNCDLILTPVKTAGSFVAGACPQAGTYTNTWTVSDDCGNVVAGVYTQVITITDNTAPTWTTAALALDATLECSDIAGLATAQGLTPAASDNCDGSLTPVKTAGPFVAGACPQAGTYTNTWTVSDDCGNVVAGVYTQVITITDNTAPTWTTAALALDATVQCSDAAALATAQGLTPAASDNCDGTLTPVKTAGAFVAGACPQAGTYTNTWTVSDDCGNVVAAVYTQIITVIDNTAPTWTTAALALDATVQCSDAAALATAQGLNPVASDNCDGTLTPVKTAGPFVAGACPQAGTYTNTWTVSDDCGNVVAGVYTQVITVIDNVNPTASNPLPINGITCKSAIPSPDITVVTDEADNCGGTPVVAFVGDADNGGAGCPADPYIVTRTYSVTDACGNSIAVTQTITVIDDVPPTITCPGPITVHMNSGCFYNGPVGTATATDNCDPSPIITHPFIGTNWPEGVNTVNYYVQDGCGNTASCTQTITVVRNALAGKLVYNNTAQTPMNNVELTLSPGALTATTGADGSYTFSGLCAGTYTVAVTSNHKPVGSINATDAGAANYWGVFGGSIETVKFLAGDVSNDEWIDGDDATRIQRYFVFGESFLRAPWSYWKQGDMVLANSFPSPVPASFSVTVSGADVSGYNLLAQCTGDFNSSFVPSGAKAANSSVRLSTEGTMVMGPNQKFDLPVRAASPMQVGAISLILDIPANFVEVTDVVLSGSSEPVSYKVTGNQVRIGWNSTTPVQFVSNSNLITLKLKTTAAFTNGNTIEIGLVSDPLNELADAGYDVIHQASLLVNNVTSGLVGVGNQQSSDLISLSNYPNPFIKSTTIAYEIPYDGKVTVEVNTMLGQRIGTLVNSTQTQGKYTVVYDAAVLQPGFYLVALKLETAKGTITRSIRLVVMR